MTIIIFSGYNQRAVIAFLRTINKHQINYSIIASSEKDTIFNTIYCKDVIYTRKNKALDLNEIMHAVDLVYNKFSCSTCLIAPSTEAMNRFMLDYRLSFENHGCIIPLVNKDLYEMISDKNKFWRLCKNNGFCTPRFLEQQELSNRQFVAKPKSYVSSNGKIYSPVIVKNNEEYNDFIRQYPLKEFDFEEYIDGASFYLLYYFTKTSECISFSQQNLIQQSGGKSIIAAIASNLHQSIISKKYEDFFVKLKYHGFVMVELRLKDGNYYMIEANPRFWGPSQLFCDAGQNLFEQFLLDYDLIDQVHDKSINYNTKYFWSGGGIIIDGTFEVNNNKYVWHKDGKEIVLKNPSAFIQSDIYNRNDTIGIYKAERKLLKKDE